MTKIDKLYINWNDVDHMVDDLINQMFADNWKPDYIVGITRGGLTPAIIMSHKTGIKMFTLDVRLRDGGPGIPTLESNTWMAQDAMAGKKIVLVDDINDTGDTAAIGYHETSIGTKRNLDARTTEDIAHSDSTTALESEGYNIYSVISKYVK